MSFTFYDLLDKAEQNIPYKFKVFLLTQQEMGDPVILMPWHAYLDQVQSTYKHRNISLFFST